MCLLYNFDLLVYLMLFYILLLLAQYKCQDVVELLKCQLYPTVVRCLFDKKIRIHPFLQHTCICNCILCHIYIIVHVFVKILHRVRTSKLFLISIDMKLYLIKSNSFTICIFFFNSKFLEKNVIYILSSDMFNVVSKHLLIW